MIRLRPVRDGTLAGFAGTSVMTATLWLERRIRTRARGPVDYDASSHVVTAAANALHLTPRTDTQRRAIFLLVHWGYGSAVGTLYEVIHARVADERRAAALYFLACQAMAFTLFPVYGQTPPPWRWRRDMLASSLIQHAIYAGVVAVAARAVVDAERVRDVGPSGQAEAARTAAAVASLRRARADDAAIVTDVYLSSREGAGDAVPPGVHPPHEVLAYVTDVLLPTQECWLALVGGTPAGVLTLDGDELNWLWVRPEFQGRGVGSELLEHAKRLRPTGLELWVFAVNTPARRFYEGRGFAPLFETDGSGNEERAPDLRYAWRPPA